MMKTMKRTRKGIGIWRRVELEEEEEEVEDVDRYGEEVEDEPGRGQRIGRCQQRKVQVNIVTDAFLQMKRHEMDVIGNQKRTRRSD